MGRSLPSLSHAFAVRLFSHSSRELLPDSDVRLARREIVPVAVKQTISSRLRENGPLQCVEHYYAAMEDDADEVLLVDLRYGLPGQRGHPTTPSMWMHAQ